MPKVLYLTTSLILLLIIVLFALTSDAFISDAEVYAASHGSCEYKKREGSRALPGEDPPGYLLTDNKCSAGYKPSLVRTAERFSCECIAEGTPVCSPPSTCTRDDGCNTAAGCGDYICVGYIGGRTPGRCQPKSTTCSKANLNCSTDSDCQSGGDGCSQYTCWTIGRGKSCRLGAQPQAVATIKCTPGVDCTSAAGKTCDGGKGIETAIGCVHTDPQLLIKDVFRLAVGIGGGIAFLLMVFGVFEMITSAGNPDALKNGQQRFVNAIIGILFIVFSTLLLQIIGVDILSIPGFTK